MHCAKRFITNNYPSAWWGKTFVDTLDEVTKNKRKSHGIGSPTTTTNGIDNHASPVGGGQRAVTFHLDSEPSSDSDSQHHEFMKKQAAAISGRDFVNSPIPPGTPIKKGEILGPSGAASDPFLDVKVNGNGNGHSVLPMREKV